MKTLSKKAVYSAVRKRKLIKQQRKNVAGNGKFKKLNKSADDQINSISDVGKQYLNHKKNKTANQGMSQEVTPGQNEKEGILKQCSKQKRRREANKGMRTVSQEVPPGQNEKKGVTKRSSNWKIKKKANKTLSTMPQDVTQNADSAVISPTVNSAKSKETRIPHNLDLEKVKASVSALMQLGDKQSKSKKSLFKDDQQPVHMTIKVVKMPGPVQTEKNYRFCLPHPLVDESSDVCLFVCNRRKGIKSNHESSIIRYQKILDKHGIKGISQIIPLRQLTVEYDQYELKDRLLHQFDVFLADSRIQGHAIKLLGQKVYKRRKLPTPLDMHAKDLKKEVKTALSKTLLMMFGRGDISSLKVGHTKHSVQQIAENIIAVAEGLAKSFPGGWANIRSLMINLQNTVPVPVYLSLKSSNEVPVPQIEFNTPKAAVPVVGELSTQSRTDVIVMPDGLVKIQKKEPTEEEIELGLTDSEDDYVKNTSMKVSKKKMYRAKRNEWKKEKQAKRTHTRMQNKIRLDRNKAKYEVKGDNIQDALKQKVIEMKERLKMERTAMKNEDTNNSEEMEVANEPEQSYLNKSANQWEEEKSMKRKQNKLKTESQKKMKKLKTK